MATYLEPNSTKSHWLLKSEVMINWIDLLQIRLESEEDASEAARRIAEALPDRILLNMITTCDRKGHRKVQVYLAEEAFKRNLYFDFPRQ